MSSRIARISSFTASSSPDDVSMIPSAPAFDTADANRLRAIQPIGACTIGIVTPSWRETRLSKAGCGYVTPANLRGQVSVVACGVISP